MRKNLKIWGAAFLMGVGAARVLVWLNTGIAHLGKCDRLAGSSLSAQQLPIK